MYRVVKAARYLGVAPWDLLSRPLAWIEMAEEYELDEMWAEAEKKHRRFWDK